MNLEDYRTLSIVATLGLALVAASPALAVVVPFEGGSERFSEFWLLDGLHRTEYYPFVVSEGEEYRVFVGVGNHMGGSEYYMVCVKFRNSTQSLPDLESSVASSLLSLYEFRFFVGDGEVWEMPVTFWFEDVVVEGDVLVVGDVIVNGVSFPVEVSAVEESEGGGFVFQLFFELWRYDVVSESFRFDNRYVGLWLSVIGG